MQLLQRLCNRTCKAQHTGQTGFRLAGACDNLRANRRPYDSSWATARAARPWPGVQLLRPLAASAQQGTSRPPLAELPASEIYNSRETDSGIISNSGSSSSSSSSSSVQGQSAAGISPGTWADGDVLRLTLADGRTVYAEAVRAPAAVRMNQKQTSSSGSRRQQQQRGGASGRKGGSAPAVAAATQTATSGGGSSSSSGPLVLVCQGCRYKLVEEGASCGGAVAVATEGSKAGAAHVAPSGEPAAGGAGSGGEGHSDASGGGSSRWTLQLLGGACGLRHVGPRLPGQPPCWREGRFLAVLHCKLATASPGSAATE